MNSQIEDMLQIGVLMSRVESSSENNCQSHVKWCSLQGSQATLDGHMGRVNFKECLLQNEFPMSQARTRTKK